MIGFYDYTVILTYMGFGCGIFGIYNALFGNSFVAVICLLVCGLCDLFDGKIARTKKRTDDEKSFGIQIDSLSDLVCFGILPIAIGYSIGLNSVLYVPYFILYGLCGLIRLAYFNVLELKKDTLFNKKKPEYIGLPITSAVLIFPLVYVFKRVSGVIFPYIYLAVMIIVAILFVVKFKIKKPGLKFSFFLIGIGLVELLLILGVIFKWF